jgi:hypothetical protein
VQGCKALAAALAERFFIVFKWLLLQIRDKDTKKR